MRKPSTDGAKRRGKAINEAETEKEIQRNMIKRGEGCEAEKENCILVLRFESAHIGLSIGMHRGAAQSW